MSQLQRSAATTATVRPRSPATTAAPASGAVAALHAAGIMPALRLGAVDDPAEREADAIADAVLADRPPPPSHAAPAVRRTCAACADEDENAPVRRRAASPSSAASPTPSASLPAAVSAATATGGAPLPPAELAFFEPRLGVDLSGVRVHTGSAADRGAAAIDALAFTAGRDVVFRSGQWRPGDPAGRRLLAHELAHVAQGGGTVRRKPPDQPAPKFYQEVLDRIAVIDADMARQLKEKTYSILVYKPMYYEPLKALAALAQAVDEARVADIPKLVDAFITIDHGPPFRALDKWLFIELMARLFTLGLESDSAKLRAKFSAGEKSDSWIREDTGVSNRDRQTHQAIVDRLIATADNSTADKSKATLVLMCRELALLREPLIEFHAKDAFTRWHEEMRGAYIGILAQLIRAIEAQLQLLLDRAANELAEGKGSATLLILRDVVENHFATAIQTADGKKDIGGLVLAQTSTTIGKKGAGTIKDAYDQGPKGRTVAVSTYDPKQDWVPELRAPLIRLPQIRREQIAVLARIYGATDALRADRPEEQERSADAAANATALKNLAASGGKLRLENDDDWRAFLLQKLKDGGKDQAVALRAVMSLLYDYLQAFTVHARYTDLYDQADFKDAYFSKPFPRSLAGQLVHDCGVYAVRVAYLLSLVGKELGLRIRWIRLPAHVGLIITGEGLPTYIAHNDHFREYDAKTLADLRAGWDATNAKARAGGAKPAKGSEDDDQFLGELGAAEFISGPLDMPFVLSDAPAPGKTAEATRKALWKDYQRVAKQDVFGAANSDAKSPNHLFHKRYLAITQRFRDWRNTHVRPFWNDKLPPLWADLEKTVTTGSDGKARSDLAGSDLAAALIVHLAAFDAARKGVDDGLAAVHADEREVGKDLRADPKLPAKNARVTQADRFSWSYAWDNYRDRVEALKAEAEAAPAARFIVIANTMIDRLQPPFIPQPQNAMGVLD